MSFCDDHAMQRLFHREPGESGLAEVAAREVASYYQRPGWIWLDVADPTAQELAEIGALFRFDVNHLEAVLDVTRFPKADHQSDYLVVVLHSAIAEGGPRLATTELHMLIGRDFLVTVHTDEIAVTEALGAEIAAESGFAYSSPASLAAAIAEAGGRRYLRLLEVLESRIEDLEEAAALADPATLTESQALRRDVILLRRVVGPQRDVLRRLNQPAPPVIDERAASDFGTTYDHYFRIVESLDAARSLLGSVVEIYRGAVAERANEVMKVLTVFSAILLPLSLLAGIWGMNFVNLPGANRTWGALAVVGVMLAIGLGLWLYFARRGFIGGPRLRDVPRAVGLGMVQLGTAPLRAVTRIGHRRPVVSEDGPDGTPSAPRS